MLNKKTGMTIALLLIASTANAYPLTDTDFLVGAYCFQMTDAPRLATDLSNEEKRFGQEAFFKVLHERELEFPDDSNYEKIRENFYAWVVNKFPGKGNAEALTWYRSNCLKNSPKMPNKALKSFASLTGTG
ncbi:MAG: hypothetical protein CVV16_05765 [Gammaproteobacteria bacterium HGW-Gammaproteobacteria-6]|jgi:hypothetical protein|nr:hypothetical protein [Pseudomonadales bacterium]PKM04279.1 MAG: hypothetical protein CVV16_05765 [Gammaproteobacteria bacterium HGW-Gammaproteobacteria-6]|tara:strand:- start:1097 stop:1489 length:393 start_codon:yes stop_codon:yes gene_type:complete